MENSLKQKAVSGILWSAIQQFGVQIVSFLSNLILARLLSPDDYGCIGLLAIFISVSNVFVTGGFVSALIQKKDATEIDYNTAFYWNIAVSFVFYLMLFFAAPYVASFYNIPTLGDILRVLGLLLIISGFSVVQNTLLRKKLQFHKLARIDITSSVISVSASILLALNGLGVWALVAQQLISRVCRCMFLWLGTTWRPISAFSITSFKSMFSYGSFLLLSDLLNNLVENVQGVLIGRWYTASDMGFYTQAKKLEGIPTSSISSLVGNVTFPLYSKIQDDKNRLRNAIRKSMKMMNYINFPLMLLLIVIARPLILLLYSEKWLNSVEYFQILCIAGMVNCMQSVNYQVVAAVGRSKELFKWNLIKRSVGVALMLIGIYYGVQGVLIGMTIGFYFTYIVNACLAKSSTGYSVFAQLKDAIPLLIISVFSAFFAYLPSLFVDCYLWLLPMQILLFLYSYLNLSQYVGLEEYCQTKEIVFGYIKGIKKRI